MTTYHLTYSTAENQWVLKRGSPVPETASVLIELYDVLGRRVAVLKDGPAETGRYTLHFDGSNLASGVYVLRAVMEAESGSAKHHFTQRLTLLK